MATQAQYILGNIITQMLQLHPCVRMSDTNTETTECV